MTRTKTCLLALCLIGGILYGGNPALADSVPNVLTGTVVTAAGTPIEAATIDVTLLGSSVSNPSSVPILGRGTTGPGGVFLIHLTLTAEALAIAGSNGNFLNLRVVAFSETVAGPTLGLAFCLGPD